jgi:hypothetical protein
MAQKVVEYVLLRDEVAKRLTEEVNARLRAGWSLYGSDLAWTGRLVWGEGPAHSIHDAMERAAESGEQKSAATDAQHWLEDYLTMKGGVVESAKIKKAAYASGHSERSLRTARSRLKIEISEHGFPWQTWWSLPNTQPAPVVTVQS